MKDHFAHRDGDEAIHAGVPVRFDGAGHVDIAQDDAAENRALRISVARQHGDADGGIRIHETNGYHGVLRKIQKKIISASHAHR